jgi:ABC-type Zn uptake system ZnuABC Zn-binding protein ZnuA
MKNLFLKFLMLIFLSSQLLAYSGASKSGMISTTIPAHNFFSKLIVKNTMKTYSLIDDGENDKFKGMSLNSKQKNFFKDNLVYFHVNSGNVALDSISSDIQKLNKKVKILEMGESDGFSWLSPKAARKQLELIYNEAKAFNKGKSETYTKNYQAADAAFIKVDGYFEKLLLNSDTIAVYENSGLNTLATDYNLKTVSAEEMDKFKVIITDTFNDDIRSQAEKLGVRVISLDPARSNWLNQMKEFLNKLNSVK